MNEEDEILQEVLPFYDDQYDHEDAAIMRMRHRRRGIAAAFEHDFLPYCRDREVFLSNILQAHMPTVDYEWRKNDLSNFLHVFWQDDLWARLPMEIILIVMKHCKTHMRESCFTTSLHGYDLLTFDFVSLYPTKYWLDRYKVKKAEVLLKSLVEPRTRAVRKKEKAPPKQKHRGGMKNFKNQPNRAMRKR